MRIPKGFPKIGHYTAMKKRGMLPPDLTTIPKNKKEFENDSNVKLPPWFKYIIISVVAFLLALIYFAEIHQTQAEIYSRKLVKRMSIEEIKTIIPYKTYGGLGLRSGGRFVGDRIDWKFSDGSLLHVYCYDNYGFSRTEISKSDHWANKALENIISLCILMMIVLFLIKAFNYERTST